MEKQHKLNFPQKLFTAQKVRISQLKENYEFEIIETIQLSGQVSGSKWAAPSERLEQSIYSNKNTQPTAREYYALCY